jgi:hypothetical protein
VSVFTEARNAIAATLTAAGVTGVSLDPRGQPPMVLVDAPSGVIPENTGTTWLLTIPVRLIYPPPGGTEALEWLLEALEPVLVALGPDECSARAGTYSLNDKDHPAYHVEVTRQLITPC